ncbi:hypothetical protein AB1A64_13180 [Ruegeria sp. ANG10]|uniref:hypothetical protein n=1 Tax=Ruegeria sp. ANG10 TaxID=3042467 RepID=UPI003451F4F8
MDYDDLPVFLCDTASRPGMSGSPVFVKAFGDFGREGAKKPNGGFFGFWTKFAGIYSGRDGTETDGFQLGRVWKADTLQKLFENPKTPERPFSVR